MIPIPEYYLVASYSKTFNISKHFTKSETHRTVHQLHLSEATDNYQDSAHFVR
jgi:hypothetical protein